MFVIKNTTQISNEAVSLYDQTTSSNIKCTRFMALLINMTLALSMLPIALSMVMHITMIRSQY